MSNEEKVHFFDEEKEECVIKTESYSTVNNPVQSVQNGNRHNQTTEISWRRILAQLPPGIVFTNADRPVGKIIATSTSKLTPAVHEVQIQTTIGLAGYKHHNQENRTLKKSSFGIYVFQKVKSDQKTSCDCKRKNILVCCKRSPTTATDNNKTDKNIKPAHTGVPSEKEAKKKASNHTCACAEGKDNSIDKRLIMMSSDRCKQCSRGQRSASVTSICINTLLNEVLIYLNQLTSEHLNSCLRCNRRISNCNFDATTSNQSPDACKEGLFQQARAYLAQLTLEHQNNCDRCKQKQNHTGSSCKPSGSKTESVLQRAWSYIQSFRSENKNCCERCKELGLPVCCKHINSANGKNLCNNYKPKTQPEIKRSSTEISNKGSCQRCKTVPIACKRQSSDEKLNEVSGPPYKTSQPICNRQSSDKNSNKGSCKRCKSAQVTCRRQSSDENLNKGRQPCKAQSSDENLTESFCLRCKSAQVACGRQSSDENLNKGSCLPCKKRPSDKNLKKKSKCKQLAEPACLASPKDSCCSHCLQGGKQVCCIHAPPNETESNNTKGILDIKGWLESTLKPKSPAETVYPKQNSCPKFCSKSSSQDSAVQMPRCRSAVPQRQCSSYLSHSKNTTFTPCCKHSSQPCATTGCKNSSNLSVNSPRKNDSSCSGQRQKSSLQSLIDCFSRTSSVEDVKKSSRSRSGCEYLDYHSSTQCSGPVQNDCPKPKQGITLSMEPNDHKFCKKPDCKHSLEADACSSLPVESHDPACDGACREKEQRQQTSNCDIEQEEPQSSGAEDSLGACVECNLPYSASGSIYQEHRMVDAEYEAFLDNHFGRMVAKELANKETICDDESCNCITCITKLPVKKKKSGGPGEDLHKYRYYY